jgi:putative protease
VKGAGEDRRVLVSPPRGMTLSERDSVRIHKGEDSGRVSYKLSFVKKEPGVSGVWISAPEGSLGDHVYLIQIKAMSKRYAPVIANKLENRGGPGRDKAPFPKIELSQREKTGDKTQKNPVLFPEGLYVAVSRPEDLYIVQSARPRQVMLALSEKNTRYLLADNKPVLPFKPSEIILTLDPWFPQEAAGYEAGMAENIEQLIDKGYYQFMLNNPGHFSLFKNLRNMPGNMPGSLPGYNKIKLIAGPWLYTFNSWALSFVSSLGVDGFVSPLENNRQNLERTLGARSVNARSQNTPRYHDNKRSGKGKKRIATGPSLINILHSRFFLTVFAWPPLFNIRADLGNILNLKTFTDNRNEVFSLVTSPEGSRVYPKGYFSIVDKIPFLKEAGCGRFIIDLSGAAFKKTDYRDLMQSIEGNTPLPHSSRFNWKDGFFSS